MSLDRRSEDAALWPGVAIPTLVGTVVALLLLLVLSRLGVSLWMAQLGRGGLADMTREILASKTFHLTGLMLYGAHFIPLNLNGPMSQVGVPVPEWAHLIPILPLLVGGYITVAMSHDLVRERRWLGATVAIPYTILLLLLMSIFTIKINIAFASASIAPSWEIAIILIPVWGLSLGAVGGLLAGRE